jgi:hypothetical protein
MKIKSTPSFLLTLLYLLAFQSKTYSYQRTEAVSFVMMNYEIHHQGINKLDIKISYWYGKQLKNNGYVNDSVLRFRVDSVLSHYPNTTDWWEIVNKNLTRFIMDQYPHIDSLASDILVHWYSGAGVEYGHRYPTRSVTSRTRSNDLYEYFGFETLPDYRVVMNGKSIPLTLSVLYQYKEDIQNTEYPDGLETENAFKKSLQGYADLIQTKYPLHALLKLANSDILQKYDQLQSIEAVMSFPGENHVQYRAERMKPPFDYGPGLIEIDNIKPGKVEKEKLVNADGINIIKFISYDSLQIVSFTFAIIYKNDSSYEEVVKGQLFTKSIKERLEKLEPGNIVVITDIYSTNPRGMEIVLSGSTYKVK